MDTNQWPQGIGVVRPTNIEAATKSGVGGGERKPRPQKEKVVNCPRCNSTNTKFCYYNNYSLSQPRYFCKTCRRYWTEGGTLRNVPVGGGSRKNRRSSTCSSSSLIKKINSDLTPPSFSSQNPKIHDGQDLNLAYNPHKGNLGINYNGPNSYMPSTTNPSITFPSLSSLMSMPISESTSVFYSSALNPLHEIKPHNKFNFSIDGIENGYNYGSVQDHPVPVQDTTARLFLPYEELKTVSTTTRSDQYDDNDQQNIKGQGESAGFWNGMLGGGGSW